MKTKYERWDIETLEAEIRRHNDLYFVAHAPEIPDVEFDRMVEALRQKAPASPALVDIVSDVRSATRANVEHRHPMLSLDKCYSYGDLEAWGGKFAGGFIAMPKVDGVAMSLRYDAHGQLTVAATRGDGRFGEEVTANARYVRTIPQAIPLHSVEVRGEIYLPLSIFRKEYAQAFANPRNLAAGAIKQKEAKKTLSYRLAFLAYDLLGTACTTEVEKRKALARCGFDTVAWAFVSYTAGLRTVGDRFLAQRDVYDFETDGMVVRVDAVQEQQRVGATAHHPRFAIAYKYQGDSALTTVTDIEWSVSRSGTITPIAIVEPVQLSGATVSRVSLHNYGLAKKLGVGKGARAIVMRRGGVIPHLESVKKAGTSVLRAPTACPSCGRAVRTEDDFLFCTQPESCGVSRVGVLKHFLEAVDCEGFGPKILEQLVSHGLVNDPADLYRLTVDDLVTLERMGEILANKLVVHVQACRVLPLEVFLRALGIPELARQTSRILAGFDSLARVRAITHKELEEIHGVGPRIAASVVAGLKSRRALIDKLLRYVTITENVPATTGRLVGKTVLFTGSLVALQRSVAHKLVEEHGGRVASGVSKQLNYLVVGEAPGSKLKKAQQLLAQGADLTILSEKEFLRMVR